jgi:hypothetical protein
MHRPLGHRRTRRRALALASLTAALAAIAVGVVSAASPDGSRRTTGFDGAAASPLDLQRVGLRRASDGRLRTAVTFAGRVSASTLLARSGPPGSVCLRIWTDARADPRASRPDRLVCVTARSADALRAGVFEQREPGLPRRVAPASVRANASGRSLIVRVAQSALGRPQVIRFAVESTRPGCERPACVDTAPDGGAVRRMRLR